MSEGTISLKLSESLFTQGLQYQLLSIDLTASDRLLKPEDIKNLKLPNGVNTKSGVVISGRAPMWVYSFLTRELHPTAWVACYDPRLGAVVSTTSCSQVCIGQVIPMIS